VLHASIEQVKVKVILVPYFIDKLDSRPGGGAYHLDLHKTITLTNDNIFSFASRSIRK
jgi:hypothetical protein